MLHYTGHTDNVFALVWSPDGRYIASGGRDATIQIWDPTTGICQHLYEIGMTSQNMMSQGATNRAPTVLSVAWSSDGSHVASGDTDGIVHIWQVDVAEPLVVYRGHKRFVRSIAWSPNSSIIASGGDFGDSTVQLWDPFTGKHLHTYSDQYRVFAVSWSLDSSLLASGSFDGTVKVRNIWDKQLSNPQTRMYQGHSGPVYTAAWSPDSHLIASGGQDATIQVWNADTGSLKQMYRGHTRAIKTLSWSPDSKYIASGSDDTTVQLWCARTGEHMFTYKGHDAWVRAVAWSPEGHFVVSVSDAVVHIWTPISCYN